MKHINPYDLIELKDGDVDPNEIVIKALGDLQKSVDDRLKVIEGKGIDPKLLERLEKVEAKANRPTGSKDTDNVDAELEKKAFETYVRKGVLTAEETKSLRVSDDTTGGYLAPSTCRWKSTATWCSFHPFARSHAY
jgi:HK97 family phage major capsid protein